MQRRDQVIRNRGLDENESRSDGGVEMNQRFELGEALSSAFHRRSCASCSAI